MDKNSIPWILQVLAEHVISKAGCALFCVQPQETSDLSNPSQLSITPPALQHINASYKPPHMEMNVNHGTETRGHGFENHH